MIVVQNPRGSVALKWADLNTQGAALSHLHTYQDPSARALPPRVLNTSNPGGLGPGNARVPGNLESSVDLVHVD